MLLSLLVSVLLAHPADTLLSPAHVTAFKEQVPLEKLASPVSIIHADAMAALGVTHPQGLSAVVPGLLIPEYGASLTSTVYLRGIGSRMENPSMGLYIDGIPVLDKNAYDFDWSHPLKRSTLSLSASLKAYGPLYWDEAGTLQEPVHLRPGARVSLVFARWELYLRGENLTGSSGRSFYFKSVGREFFCRERPASIVLGIHINI